MTDEKKPEAEPRPTLASLFDALLGPGASERVDQSYQQRIREMAEKRRPPNAREVFHGTTRIFAFGILLTPISAWIIGSCMQAIWRWFLAAEYGEGPSIWAWWGIGLLLGMSVLAPLFERMPPSKEMQEDPKYQMKNPGTFVLTTAIRSWFTAALFALVAAFAKFVWLPILEWIAR